MRLAASIVGAQSVAGLVVGADLIPRVFSVFLGTLETVLTCTSFLDRIKEPNANLGGR